MRVYKSWYFGIKMVYCVIVRTSLDIGMNINRQSHSLPPGSSPSH